MRVRTHNDIDQWLKFFLAGVLEISKKGIETFDSILQLEGNLEGKIQSLGSRGNVKRKVIDHLFRHPVIDASKIGAITGKSRATNYKLIDELECGWWVRPHDTSLFDCNRGPDCGLPPLLRVPKGPAPDLHLSA